MKEDHSKIKARMNSRKGLAKRVVVQKEGKNDELYAQLIKLAEKMNQDISSAPNEMNVRMW